jgi:LacI family transcriptional regulator
MSNGQGQPRARIEPTITQVAEVAGVSIGTVSNVLNSPDKVAPATRERVLEAIGRVGFIRNGNARSLASGTVHTISLVVPDITNSVFVDMSRGAQSASGKLGLSLLIASAESDPAVQDRYLDVFAEARSRGILLAPMSDSRAGIQRVRDHGRRVVIMNYDAPDLDVCTVLMNNYAGGRMAADHVIELGYRRLLFVGASDELQPVRDRRCGIRDVAREAGISFDEMDVQDLRREGEGLRVGTAIAERWSPGDEPLAVLIVTDTLAEGALNAILAKREIRVPEDIALMGLDGNKMSWDTPIAMTTLELPGFAMGAEAVRLLIAESELDHVHERVVLPVALHARESTLGRRAQS